MPSSLIFAGLVVAWLLILVPLVARRRQQVVRPSDAALACRVLDRPTVVSRRLQEVTEVEELDEKTKVRDEAGEPAELVEVPEPREPSAPAAESDAAESDAAESDAAESDAAESDAAESDAGDRPGAVDRPDSAEAEAVTQTDRQTGFRPGRGGFDPEAAALAASARYAFRQRVVLALLLGAMATGLIAFFGLPAVWWLHGLLDLVLVGYLAQLRRQVRLEEEIRHRRSARMAGTRRPHTAEPPGSGRQPESAEAVSMSESVAEATDSPAGKNAGTTAGTNAGTNAGRESAPAETAEATEPEQPALPALQPAPAPQRPSGTSVVALDDEDPELDQLDEPGPRYRRAVGE